MKFIPEHVQSSFEEVKKLMEANSTLTLVTQGERPRVGLYNYYLKDKTFYIHMGKKDEQLLDLKKNPGALVFFSEVLSVIPSFWVDQRYGGAINNFFKYSEFECTTTLLETPKEILPILKEMLELYQKEKDYDPLDIESEIYRHKFAMLTVVELKIESQRTKWNLGQTKPREAFFNIIEQLVKRREGQDLKTAEEMKKLQL